jgi:hypothetical protein
MALRKVIVVAPTGSAGTYRNTRERAWEPPTVAS